MTQRNDDLRIAQYNQRIFLLAMCDHWDASDYALDTRLRQECNACIKQYREKYGADPLVLGCRYREDVENLISRLEGRA